ncbi:MAG: hypothetical protein GY940_12210, partial [bacterium]|nr:hypothetical protein [bacterium]
RGYGIELGESESKLLEHANVKDAVVLAVEDQTGDKCLCAFFVPCRGVNEETPGGMKEELKNYLSVSLPGYMIPAYFISLESIPLTPNGKVDRRFLPSPLTNRGKNYLAPRTGIEKTLVSLWSEVLGVNKDNIGRTADFFDLGGHSLKATLLVSRLHKELQVKLSLADLFEKPTVAELARHIEAAVTDKYVPLTPVEEKDYYVLTSAQKRMYFMQQLDSRSTVYNLPQAVILEGEVEGLILEEVFSRLIR